VCASVLCGREVLFSFFIVPDDGRRSNGESSLACNMRTLPAVDRTLEINVVVAAIFVVIEDGFILCYD